MEQTSPFIVSFAHTQELKVGRCYSYYTRSDMPADAADAAAIMIYSILSKKNKRIQSKKIEIYLASMLLLF